MPTPATQAMATWESRLEALQDLMYIEPLSEDEEAPELCARAAQAPELPSRASSAPSKGPKAARNESTGTAEPQASKTDVPASSPPNDPALSALKDIMASFAFVEGSP